MYISKVFYKNFDKTLLQIKLHNLIKIQLFIILSYEDLTTTHSGSCADDLYH